MYIKLGFYNYDLDRVEYNEYVEFISAIYREFGDYEIDEVSYKNYEFPDLIIKDIDITFIHICRYSIEIYYIDKKGKEQNTWFDKDYIERIEIINE